MTKTELQAKIAKMEKGLDNPNIQGAAREALEQSLKKAKDQLAGMAEPKAVEVKPAPVKSTKKATTPAKTAPKKVTASKSSAASQPPAYSWKKKADLAQLKPISINCQHFHLEVKTATKVSLKRTGKSTMVVTANPGDHIIFDHEGYAVYIMEAGSFTKKCTTTTLPKKVAVKKATTSKSTAKKVAKKTTTSKPNAKKQATKKKTAAKKTSTRKAPSTYTKAINSFDKEVDNIRTTYKKPEADQEQVKADLKALASKADQKNYTDYVERKIKRLDKDGVRITKEEIIRMGIALRPLVQSIRGTLQDAQNTNRKVLDPTLDNLVRWAKSPGNYDLVGVDAAVTEKSTTTAKVKPKEKKRFLEWVFGE